MPYHYHLLIKTNFENTLSKYMNDVENSYSRYFNIKLDRKGPLWQSAFKFVKVFSNSQLLHISRYIHLNPTTSGLVQNPEDWLYSSYNLYINNPQTLAQVSEISISTEKNIRRLSKTEKIPIP
jgi:putative transposase